MSQLKFIETSAKKLLAFPILRLVLIACLNFLFINKTFRSYFEKNIFNPYFIPSIKENQIRIQAESIMKEIGDIKGKTLLELGPGGDCLLACHFLKAGAKKVILLDRENYIHIPASEEKKYQSIFPEVLDSKGALNPDAISILSYQADNAIPLTNDSIDIVYSLAVFEHVAHPDHLIREIRRVLKPSGISYHQIDFRDHVFQQTSLLFLFFPKKFSIFFSPELVCGQIGFVIPNGKNSSQKINLFSCEKKQLVRQ